MSLKYGWYGSDLIKACLELDELVLYMRYSNEYYFYLDIPGLDYPAVGSIMGSGGEEYGLNMFCGVNGLESFMALLGGAHPREVTRKVQMMGYSLVKAADLSHECKKWIKSTKYKYSAGDTLPELLVVEPGKFARCPNDKETRILLYAVRGIIKSWMGKTFAPRCSPPETGIFTLVVTGEPDNPKVTTEFRYPDGKTQKAPTPTVDSVNMFEFSGLPRRDEKWIVGVTNMPIPVDDEGTMATAMFIADEDKGPIATNMVLGPDAPNSWLALMEIITGNVNAENLPIDAPEPGLPKSILFRDRDLCEIAEANLKPLGVECEYSPDDERINRIFDSFQDTMDRVISGDIPEELREQYDKLMGNMLEGDDNELLEDIIGWDCPEDDDLKGWKAVDGCLKDMMCGIVAEDIYDSSRAQKKYFGAGDFDYLMDTYERLAIDESYLAWLAFSYRPTKKSIPLAEKWLKDETLHPAVTELVREVLKTPTSLYRIDKINKKKGLIELEDILLGGKVTITDFMMSKCMDTRFLITARIYPAGNFHFILPSGPVFNQLQIPRVLDCLTYCNLKFERKNMLANAHVFGWLWDFYDELANQPLQLANTDGEILLLHTASFKIADEQALINALNKRKDVFWDEDDDCYHWVKKGSKQNGLESVLVGRLTIIADELLLDVNSEERYQRGRKWIEKIKGITFGNVNVRYPTKDNIPLDEKFASQAEPDISEMPEEVKQMLKTQMQDYYMQWLDTEIPALDNMTPRQAASMKDMQLRLKALIRTFNAPSTPQGLEIQPPAEMIMRELGLE